MKSFRNFMMLQNHRFGLEKINDRSRMSAVWSLYLADDNTWFMSKLFKDFGLGVSTAFQGFGFAFRNKMGHFFIYPLIMTIIITRLGLKFIKSGVEILSGWFRSFLGIEAVEMADESWWEMFKTFLANSADYLISFVLWVVFYFLLHKTIKYV